MQMTLRCIFLTAAALALTGTQVHSKAEFACRNQVQVGGAKRPTESQAKASARSRWSDVVEAKYGRSWAQLSRAQNPSYACRGNFYCEFAANPCGPVTPPNLSTTLNSGRILRSPLD